MTALVATGLPGEDLERARASAGCRHQQLQWVINTDSQPCVGPHEYVHLFVHRQTATSSLS
eukprot:scaffold124976_cov53-Prasinocladus_malaysianus.AAC.2